MSLVKRVSTYKPKNGSKPKLGKQTNTVIRKNKVKSKKKGKPKFRSGFEEMFWDANHKIIPLQYEPFRLQYTITEDKSYLPDFVTSDPFKKEHARHKYTVFETKGYFQSKDRKNLLNVRRCNPDVRIVLVFQKDNKLTKAKNGLTYSGWAMKNNFDFCIGTDLSKIVFAGNPNRDAKAEYKKHYGKV